MPGQAATLNRQAGCAREASETLSAHAGGLGRVLDSPPLLPPQPPPVGMCTRACPPHTPPPLLPRPLLPTFRLRRTNFGAPRKDRTGALGVVAPSAADVDRPGQPQAGGLHTVAASWAALGGGSSAEDVAQELVERGGWFVRSNSAH